MKRFTLWSLFLASAFTGLNAEIHIRAGSDTRALPPLCATCPTGAATFCNLCVTGTGVIGSLTIQNSLTLCPGVTAPCGCTFNDSLSFNTDSTHYNVKDFDDNPQIPLPFQPYFNGVTGYRDTITGWQMPPTSDVEATPLVITAEFEVPADLDPSVTPVVTLHWFNPNPVPLDCGGTFVNWQVTADYFSNLAVVPTPPGVPKYILSTGNIPVTYATGTNLVQQQVNIPLTGLPLVPGAYGQISVTRIAPTSGVESSCRLYLTVIALKYRKLAQ